jgi:hypothetical protein
MQYVKNPISTLSLAFVSLSLQVLKPEYLPTISSFEKFTGLLELYARESHALSQDRSFITARKITKKNTLRLA